MMTLLLLALAAGPAPTEKRAASPVPPKDAPVAVSVTPAANKTKAMAAALHQGITQCGLCHSTNGWTEVKFNHDKTGFPLTGGHTQVTCKACHTVDFERPLARTCAGCHRDVHAGDLGVRCEGCHDTTTWRSRLDVDAHRRTNFPLLGGHAALPCVECHFEASERRFSRATVDCGSCHQADYQGTVMKSVNHVAFNFDPVKCRTCHGPFRFYPALFPAHDTCFPINRGAHAGISCGKCHTTFSFSSMPGSCNTGTADCKSCHAHTCTGPGGQTDTDKQHTNVVGYQCSNTKCFQCHYAARTTP